jgi:hypothetical protein
VERRRVLWLDADDLDLGIEPFDIGRDTGDQPATADRTKMACGGSGCWRRISIPMVP